METHNHMHTRAHTHTHAHMHTCTHTHMHTHTHTGLWTSLPMRPLPSPLSWTLVLRSLISSRHCSRRCWGCARLLSPHTHTLQTLTQRQLQQRGCEDLNST